MRWKIENCLISASARLMTGRWDIPNVFSLFNCTFLRSTHTCSFSWISIDDNPERVTLCGFSAITAQIWNMKIKMKVVETIVRLENMISYKNKTLSMHAGMSKQTQVCATPSRKPSAQTPDLSNPCRRAKNNLCPLHHKISFPFQVLNTSCEKSSIHPSRWVVNYRRRSGAQVSPRCGGNRNRRSRS